MFVNNEKEFQQMKSVDIKKTFLYIGNSLSKTKKCLALYNESFIAKNLESAKVFLNESFAAHDHLPDLIILDIPYNINNHYDFISWLKKHFSTNIPIIYNEPAI